MEKTTIGLLIVVNFMYVCIGAAIFRTLESTNEAKSSSEIRSTVDAFLGKHYRYLSFLIITVCLCFMVFLLPQTFTLFSYYSLGALFRLF